MKMKSKKSRHKSLNQENDRIYRKYHWNDDPTLELQHWIIVISALLMLLLFALTQKI